MGQYEVLQFLPLRIIRYRQQAALGMIHKQMTHHSYTPIFHMLSQDMSRKHSITFYHDNISYHFSNNRPPDPPPNISTRPARRVYHRLYVVPAYILSTYPVHSETSLSFPHVHLPLRTPWSGVAENEVMPGRCLYLLQPPYLCDHYS